MTPGHTPEGLTVLAFDAKKSVDVPYAAFTGDTLFIGDVGRPDLLASIGVTANELAEMLYHSINRLKELPDETLVYPAHGAGSLCGKALSDAAVSSIGEQKKFNYALQPMSKEEFMKIVEVDQPFAPGYFVHDAIMNRKEHSTLEAAMQKSLRPIPLKEVLVAQKASVQIVDTRAAVDFAAGHLKGALNVGIEGKYATWAGTFLAKDKPIIVVAAEGMEQESIMRLGRIGFDHVQGYLEGGIDSLDAHPESVERVQRITANAIDELDQDFVVLDVRAAKEREAGAIDGSINIPLNELSNRWNEVPQNKLVVVHCAGGYRSSIAVSVLQQHGLTKLMDLVGGFKAWELSHRSTTAC
jgi:hydroxyacylglutathione hydrolase